MEPNHMRLEFVDRKDELETISRLIRIKPSQARVIALDGPAGMGKTRLLLEACRILVRDADRRQVDWRIVRLDFRMYFPEHEHQQNQVQYHNRETVIEEIAFQLCRDTQWSNINKLIETIDASIDPDHLLLIRQAADIPMEDETRQALLKLVKGVSSEDLERINHIITEAFKNADIQEARKRGELRTVTGLIGFILDNHGRPTPPHIPNHVLLILDGVDAIANGDGLRHWVVNELAPGLGVHDGLHNAFERFAVVVSGRFLEQDVDPQRRGRDFQEIVLRSFSNKSVYVGELIRQFRDEIFNANDYLVSRLARRLCQACGGHPRVIKEMAITLHDGPGHFAALSMDPEGVGYWYAQEQFKEKLDQYRTDAILEILSDIDEQKRDLLKLLSVFRKFNAATLEFLSHKIKEQQLHKFYGWFDGDIKGLYRRLQQTRLIGNDEAKDPFDSDRFSLSLLSAQIQEDDPKTFGMLNEWAAGLFADWVRGRFSDDPDTPLMPNPEIQRVSVCEWLFHRLRLAECCSELSDADRIGVQISAELETILKHILPDPFEGKAGPLKRIRGDIEKDEQIDHLIWDISLENPTRHDTIRNKILQVFQEEATT